MATCDVCTHPPLVDLVTESHDIITVMTEEHILACFSFDRGNYGSPLITVV